MKLLLSFYFLLIFFVFCQYFNLQILNYQKYQLKAGNNSLRKIILKAPRGIIYDRNNKPIVDNKSIYDINLIPKDFNPDSFNYRLFNEIVDIEKQNIDSVFLKNKSSISQFRPHLVKRNVNFEKKSLLEENKLDIKGIYFSNSPIRTYTSNSNLSHVLGYLRNVDGIVGYSGIEKFYENDLKGYDGLEYHIVDRFGIYQGKFENEHIYNPRQGNDLFLTIDANLQSFSEKIMGEYIGSIIVMDPETGEILTMLSNPSYELDSFASGISLKEWKKLLNNQSKPFNNRAIQSSYPPGSIFKLILAAIVLEERIINKNWEVNCTGEYQFYDQKFRCWKEEGHGFVNLSQAIQKSCNIYFYNLIQQIDFNLWSEETLRFGFGNLSGIDLPSEREGLVPNRKWMNKHFKNKGGWSQGHLLNLSIGQGETMVTPIQIINLINIISNDGVSITPHLNIDYNGIKKRDMGYSKDVWKIIKKSMYDAVNKSGGTAYNAYINDKDLKIYGKTGTAQICGNCDLLPHAWFAGFIELKNNKKFSVAIIVENGGKGSNIPSVMARKIFEFIVREDV